MKAIFTARLSGPPKWSTLNIYDYLSQKYDDITLVFEDVIPKMESVETTFLFKQQKEIWERMNIKVLLSSETISNNEIEENLSLMTIKDLYYVVPEKIKMGMSGVCVKDVIHFIRLCSVINHFYNYKWISGSGLEKVFTILNKKGNHVIDYEFIPDFPKSYYKDSKYIKNPLLIDKRENQDLINLASSLWEKYQISFNY